jgi:transcriptional regulator with XRE-family HTH domain
MSGSRGAIREGQDGANSVALPLDDGVCWKLLIRFQAMSDSQEKVERGGAAVAVDGTRVRTIREEKRLTQLYVASVVGVTTDTISRWENNRYPTIKGENALRLAQALEVPLADIIRQEPSAPSVAESPAETEPALPPRRRMPLFVAAGIGVLLVALLVFLQRGREDISAARKLPHGTAPGMLLPVRITVERGDGGAGGIIVRERLPDGWVLTGAIPPTAGQTTSGEVKWLLPAGSAVTVISYAVRVPVSWPLGRRAAFDGRIAVERGDGLGSPVVIAGGRECVVGPIHWADVNGDGRIDDQEIMPAYYLTEEMKGLLADWPLVESIWSNRGYVWDRERRQYRVLP